MGITKRKLIKTLQTELNRVDPNYDLFDNLPKSDEDCFTERLEFGTSEYMVIDILLD